jgi:hypothetical protein
MHHDPPLVFDLAMLLHNRSNRPFENNLLKHLEEPLAAPWLRADTPLSAPIAAEFAKACSCSRHAQAMQRFFDVLNQAISLGSLDTVRELLDTPCEKGGGMKNLRPTLAELYDLFDENSKHPLILGLRTRIQSLLHTSALTRLSDEVIFALALQPPMLPPELHEEERCYHTLLRRGDLEQVAAFLKRKQIAKPPISSSPHDDESIFS